MAQSAAGDPIASRLRLNEVGTIDARRAALSLAQISMWMGESASGSGPTAQCRTGNGGAAARRIASTVRSVLRFGSHRVDSARSPAQQCLTASPGACTVDLVTYVCMLADIATRDRTVRPAAGRAESKRTWDEHPKVLTKVRRHRASAR